MGRAPHRRRVPLRRRGDHAAGDTRGRDRAAPKVKGKVTEKLPDGRRTIPIDGPLVTTLREWLLRRGRPGLDERLVGVNGKLVRSRGRDKLVAACVELGIEPFTWHGVRRRVVRRLRRKGVSVTAAAAYLGHSPLVMLRLYDESNDDDLEDEMAKVWKSRDG